MWGVVGYLSFVICWMGRSSVGAIFRPDEGSDEGQEIPLGKRDLHLLLDLCDAEHFFQGGNTTADLIDAVGIDRLHAFADALTPDL